MKFEGVLANAFDLNKVLGILTSILAYVARVSGLDYLLGGNIHVSGSCKGGTGAAVGVAVSLGWRDTEGYRMLGAYWSVLVGGFNFKFGVNDQNHHKVVTGFGLVGASFGVTLYVKPA